MKILLKLALFFRRIAEFLEGCTKPAHPIPSTPPHVPVKEIIDKQMRLRTLLSKNDLAADEQKELADLVSQFDGEIIFLDSPVHATAKEEL
jgi:hypothetical protein